MLEDGEPGRSPAEFGQQMRDGARGCAILGQQQQPSMRREMQAQRIDRAAVQAQSVC